MLICMMYYQGGVYVITSTQLDLAFMYAGRGLDSLAYRPAGSYSYTIGRPVKKGQKLILILSVKVGIF